MIEQMNSTFNTLNYKLHTVKFAPWPTNDMQLVLYSTNLTTVKYNIFCANIKRSTFDTSRYTVKVTQTEGRIKEYKNA